VRFEALLLSAYGRFSDLRLDLSGGAPGGFHVIFGENEAGKSTSLRAVKSLLYGIPANSPDAYSVPVSQLRVGAEIVVDGVKRTIFRRKHRGASLLDETGEPVSEAWLAKELGGLDQRSFEARFGLDQVELERGAQALLSGSEEGLFAAGAAGADVRGLLLSLREEAEAIYSKRGRVRPLNQAVERYREALRSQGTCVRSAESWLEQERASLALALRIEKLREARRTAKLEHLELGRLGSMLSQFTERKSVREALTSLRAELPAGAPLGPDARTERLALERAAREAELLLVERGKETSLLRAKLTVLEHPESVTRRQRLLGLGGALSNLRERIGSARNAASALPRLEARQKVELAQVARALRAARIELSGSKEAEAGRGTRSFLVEVSEALPARSVQKSLRQLCSERERLILEQRALVKRIDELTLSAVSDEQDGSREAWEREQQRWRAWLNEARELEGEIRSVSERRAHFERLRRDVNELALTLGMGEGEVAVAPWAILPSEVELRSLLQTLLQRFARADELGAQLEAFGLELDELEGELRVLRGGADEVPSTEALQKLREQRDHIIRQVEPGLSHDQATELRSHLETTALRADQLADVLRVDAARVARLGELTARAAKGEARRRWLGEQLGSVLAKLEVEQARLQPICSEFRASVRTANDAQAFLTQVQKLYELRSKCQDLRSVGSELEPLEQGVVAHKAKLLEAWVEGPSGHVSMASVTPFIERCERRVLELEELRRKASLKRERTEEATKELKVQRAVLDRLKQKLEESSARLGSLLGAVRNQAAGATGASDELEVDLLLEAWETAMVPLTEAKGYEQRMEGIARDQELLETEVRTWVDEAARELAAESTLTAAEGLLRLWTTADQESAELSRILQLLREREQKESQLRLGLQEALAGLAELRRRANVAEHVKLDHLEDVSERYRSESARLEELEEALAEKAGDYPLDELEARAGSTTHNEVFGRIEELSEHIDELNETISQAEAEQNGIKTALGRFQTADAAEARQLVMHRGEEVRQLLRRHLKLRLAHDSLGRAMSIFSERFSAPLLERGSVLFRELTRGLYQRLRVDARDRTLEVLSDDRVLNVEDLSRGARAQLYFALRVASLEEYFKKHPPIPLVFDDLLVDFDDERAAAALEILGELAQRTQVLYFTHLSRDLERASDVLGAGRFFPHVLPQVVVPALGR